ncbi:rhomboid family intramembrane serine protease [Mucilaginibacter sp. UYCu711]|uniref:rhomboid family intramembrane serine protease n=1 Tax=Mucilaginibacter sp. UYCu711 TaxID=3156339 RepID=UPI003D19C7AE
MNTHLNSLMGLGFPVTVSLMVIIFCVSAIAIYNKKLFADLLLHPSSVKKDKQYYRLLSADLVHNDFIHLLLNEITLYVFCSDLEEILNRKSDYGSWQFLEIFIISQLFCNVWYTLKNASKFTYSSAGCSGSIMGCLFAFMIIDPNGTAFTYSFIGGIKNIYTGLIYILLLVFYKWKRGNDMVNHELHFYGALGGVTAALVVYPPILF